MPDVHVDLRPEPPREPCGDGSGIEQIGQTTPQVQCDGCVDGVNRSSPVKDVVSPAVHRGEGDVEFATPGDPLVCNDQWAVGGEAAEIEFVGAHVERGDAVGIAVKRARMAVEVGG